MKNNIDLFGFIKKTYLSEKTMQSYEFNLLTALSIITVVTMSHIMYAGGNLGAAGAFGLGMFFCLMGAILITLISMLINVAFFSSDDIKVRHVVTTFALIVGFLLAAYYISNALMWATYVLAIFRGV